MGADGEGGYKGGWVGCREGPPQDKRDIFRCRVLCLLLFFLIQYSVFWGFFFECEQTKFDLSRSQVRKWLYEETAKQNHPPPSAT